ncbi:MAG TPA: extracellular solute-binding protein [Candidatus Limnocylindrales bacterium]|nr:extracellular solute-binding protein [Candidatus Limnocylindrales bacterium]
MHRSLARLAVLLAVTSLVLGACGGAASPSPSASAAAVASASPSAASQGPSVPPTVPPGGPVQIKWFCCLGGGDDQLKTFDKVIKSFNASHPNIKLVLDHVAYSGARDAFATRLASGNPPDIVGPLGVGGAHAFEGQWLDLQPYIEKNKIDTSGFDPTLLNLYKEDAGTLGIPFAIYPSELYYQPDMFDASDLEYPPATYGEQYKKADGSTVEWNYDTLRDVAMQLTIDKAGKNATESGFDPKTMVQAGFEPQRDDLRTMGAAYFAAGKFLSDDGKTVQIPDAWAAAWKWIYDGMWKDHFILTGPQYNSQGFNGGGYAFNSGKVAMQENFLWNVCCVTEAGGNWNLGALPSYNGKATVPMNADSFRITKNSKHPDEAFTALQYLILGEGHTDLLNSISGFPALKSEQGSFFQQLEQQKDDKGKLIYPAGINWDVVTAGIPNADVDPNSEAFMPNYNKSLDVLGKYNTRWQSTPGLNMDTELANLKSELQKVWNAAG